MRIQRVMMPDIKVLVVDDVGLMCDQMRSLLNQRRINDVVIATSMIDANRMLKESIFNLAFIDIELHEQNGLTLLPVIKKKSPDTRVIIVSGHSTSANVKEALENGADGFLVKPYSGKRLDGILKKCGIH